MKIRKKCVVVLGKCIDCQNVGKELFNENEANGIKLREKLISTTQPKI